MKRFIAIAVFAFSAVAGQAWAQGVTAPVFRAGDEMKYRVVDLWTNNVEEVFIRRVVKVDEQEIHFQDEKENGQVLGTTVINKGWQIVPEKITGRRGAYYEPYLIDFASVLKGAQAWKEKDFEFPRNDGNGRIIEKLSSKVIGKGEVKVPAGTFSVVIVKSEGKYENHHSSSGKEGEGLVNKTVSFHPELGPVKMEYNNTRWNGSAFRKNSIEVVSFKLQQRKGKADGPVDVTK